MTWALAQAVVSVQNPSGTTTTLSATFGSAVTAGNLIVAAISNYSGGTMTVQDSVNTTNYAQKVLSASIDIQSGIYTFIAPIGGTGFEVTMTSTNASVPGIAIYEFSFGSGSGNILTYETPTGNGTASGSTPATGNLTITGNDLVFAATAFGAAVTPTAGSGFTLGTDGAFSAFICEGLATEYILNQTGSPVTPTFSLTGSASYSMSSLAIKAAPPVALIGLVPYVSKNGLFVIGVTNPAGTACSNITSLGTAPTLYVNGSEATLYGPVWYDVDHDAPFVTFQVTSPSSVASTDTLTYTIPTNGINTSLGGNLAITTQAAVTNYVGQLEPGFGGCTSFVPNRKMQIGVNLGGQSWANYGPQRVAKNLRYIMYFSAGEATTVTYNSSDPTLPESWTPSGAMNSQLANYGNPNGIEDSTGQVGYPVPQGQWGFQFKDVNASNSNALKLWLVGNPLTCVGSDTATGGFHGVAGSTGVRTVGTDGITVTITYQLSYPGWPTLNTAHGYNMALQVYVSSPVGLWASGNTITDFWAFAPGDEDMNTSNPLAMPNTLRTALTAPNGNGPSIIRALETIAPAGYGNFQNFADCQNINAFGWGGGIPTPSIGLSAVRFYNTNPALDNVSGNSTHGWAASKHVYDSRLGFDGTDSVGFFLDLSARPGLGGETDYGQYMNPFGGVASYAALEFVTTAPHNLRSGDYVLFPVGNSTTVFTFPITGATQTALSGTVSVTHGSQSVTFSTSQTLATDQGLIFGSDTTGGAYYITAGGTGTTFMIEPQFQGTTSATSSCKTTPFVDISNLSQIVHVTGASTFALACGLTFGVTSGTKIQTITSTKQISLSAGFSCSPQMSGGTGPYGFYANLASQWPGTKLLVPLMPYMTDACLQSIADEIAVNALANATVLFELGDEHWNIPGFPTGLATSAYGRLMAFAPPLEVVNSYYTVPTSPVGLNSDYAYTLILAHQHDVIQAQFDTHNKGLHAGRMFSGFWVGSNIATNMVTFASGALGNPSTGGLQQNIPMEYIAVAPYPAGPAGNVTWEHACATTGTDPGSWPVALMHDFFRLYCKYSSGLWTLYSSNYEACQAYAGPTGYPGQTAGKPTMIGYESQLQNISPNAGFGLEHDLFYAPQMADTWTACFGSMQDGSPLVAGSGLAFTCIYTFGSEWGNSSSLGDLWSIQIYGAQLSGSGSGNLFATAQGGNPADGLCHDVSNVTVEGEQMKQWFAAANTYSPTVSTASARRWFPGLNRLLRT